jgi:DNA-binding MarR family transcriptional regulator
VTGWRSWLKQSDANLMIPPMTAEQREAFFETVEEDGQINVPVTLYYSGEKPSDAVLAKPGWWKQPSHLKHTELGDGANRLDAGEIVLDINWKEECADLFRVLFLKGGGPSGENIDPWKMTFGLNLKRRQLNSNQYRDLVRDMRRKFPDLPALQIAKRIGISPTTVGKYTEELEAAGDISSVEVSKDTRGRASPTRKPRKTAAEKAAEPQPSRRLASARPRRKRRSTRSRKRRQTHLARRWSPRGARKPTRSSKLHRLPSKPKLHRRTLARPSPCRSR